MIFWNPLAFSMIQQMLAIWFLVPLLFLKPGNIWKFTVHILLKPGLENFERVRWVQLCSSLSILWHCLSLGLEWKLTFSSPVATAEFSKFADILRTVLSQHHLSGFGIAQLEFHHLPLALSVVMLSKAHLTSHSRMSGSRSVITASWLSGLWRWSFMFIL